MQQHLDSYQNLSQAERDELEELARELSDEKAMKAVARRPTNRSKALFSALALEGFYLIRKK